MAADNNDRSVIASRIMAAFISAAGSRAERLLSAKPGTEGSLEEIWERVVKAVSI